MTKTIEELKLLAKEKAFDVHLYEGEFSHHETEYTFTESSIFELLQAQDPLQGELVALTKTIDELVNRFLRWKLPKGFSPDGGISFKRIPDFPELNKGEYEPVGTNLFTADQAKEMFEYLLDDEPTVLNNMTNSPEQVAKYIKQNRPDISKELAKHFKPQDPLQGELVALQKDKAELIEKINTLFDAIKHGDDEHKDWLKVAINKHFSIPLPKCME